MRILLVTFSDILPYALTQVLNPANEYCAILVDEPDIAKKILSDNYAWRIFIEERRKNPKPQLLTIGVGSVNPIQSKKTFRLWTII